LEEQILKFESEVDVALSEMNSKTTIRVWRGRSEPTDYFRGRCPLRNPHRLLLFWPTFLVETKSVKSLKDNVTIYDKLTNTPGVCEVELQFLVYAKIVNVFAIYK
jgi:hypothetical protein